MEIIKFENINLDSGNYTEHISTLPELCAEFIHVIAGLPKYIFLY